MRNDKAASEGRPFSYHIIVRPLPGEGAFALLLPADEWITGTISPMSYPIVFAYGPASLIADALYRGANDFLRDGWTLEELESRLGRFLKPRFRSSAGVIFLEGCSLHFNEKTAELGAEEQRILEFLTANLGTMVPRKAISYIVWGEERISSRALDMHIARLRAKLDSLDPGTGAYLRSARGRGYGLIAKPVDKLYISSG